MTTPIAVTGATGHIGACVVRELQGAGHQVSGLARSERSAAALVAAGVAAVRGGVDDLAVLRAAAAAADGVIHLAFQHDLAFSGGFAEAAANELRAVEAMGEALAHLNHLWRRARLRRVHGPDDTLRFAPA